MRIAIVGSGPAALMAADVVSSQKIPVDLYEKRAGIGRKLAIAGSSGLNITHNAPLADFISCYRDHQDLWRSCLSRFDRPAWLNFLHGLGLKTFLGTSDRYFIEDMNAAKLLRLWKERLTKQGVNFHFESECTGFTQTSEGTYELAFHGKKQIHAAVIFALGGGSYLEDDRTRWPEIFKVHGVKTVPFAASNVGYQVSWPEGFINEALRKPIKNVVLHSSRGTKRGDLLITEYGLEGTPIYFVGASEKVHLDLKPDLEIAQMKEKCERAKENLSPIRRVQKYLNLDEAAFALLFHLTAEEDRRDLDRLLARCKHFPIELRGPQPLAEAISSSGGIAIEEVDENLMLKKLPGIFVAGEMLDWDAPTGGFLIQGCVTQGFVAGSGAIKYSARRLH